MMRFARALVLIVLIVLMVLNGSSTAASWAAAESLTGDPGSVRRPAIELVVDAGSGSPLDFGGAGVGFGSPVSVLSQSWRRSLALSGGAGFALANSRMLMVSVHYGSYEFQP